MLQIRKAKSPSLKSLNILLMGAVVVGLLVVKSTLMPILEPSLAAFIEPLWVVFLYLGEKRNLLEGLLMTLFFSHLLSLQSGAPVGVFLVCALIVFGIGRSGGRWVHFEAANTFIGWVVFALLAAKLGQWVASWILFGHVAWIGSVWDFFLWLGLNIAWAYGGWHLLLAVDRLTHRAKALRVPLEGS